jgi:hypothetical protein
MTSISVKQLKDMRHALESSALLISFLMGRGRFTHLFVCFSSASFLPLLKVSSYVFGGTLELFVGCS